MSKENLMSITETIGKLSLRRISFTRGGAAVLVFRPIVVNSLTVESLFSTYL